MEPHIAKTLTDAYARKIHPRMDFTTEEGRTYAMHLAPYLTPHVRPGMRALDLGCSFGKSAFLLCELGAVVTGVDVSFGALRFAANIGRKINARIAFACADYARLPFRRESFDLVLFPHNVVECLPAEFKAVVDEYHQVLAVGGLFAVSVANKWATDDQPVPELKNDTITIPSEGTFPYPMYSWSRKAVQKVVSSYFQTFEIRDMPERNGTWMVFSKVR